MPDATPHSHGWRHGRAGADEIPGLVQLVPNTGEPTSDPTTPQEGDLLVGEDSPPGFSLLPFDPADTSVLRSVLGADFGDTSPSWKALLDGTDPAAVAEDATPGTSLIAAHRDHVHRSNKLLSDIETYERFVIVAHRGDMNATDGYPEGTLEGYRMAAMKGVNAVDLDVRLSSSGTWYVMHDSTVDRTTDGTGTIVGKTDSQVNALAIDGGYGYVAARHASPVLRVPTLTSVITALKPYDITYNLDMKVTADGATLAAYIVAQELVHRVLVIVYASSAKTAIQAVDPRIRCFVSGTDTTEGAWDVYTAANVLASAPVGFRVIVPIEDFGTADEAEIVETAFERGARYVIANDIDAALAGKATALGGSATAAVGGGPAYVPLGSNAPEGESYDNDSGAASFTPFGAPVSRKLGASNFTFDPLTVVFEAHLKTFDSGVQAKARLYDITDGVVVGGSTIVTSSEDPVRLRSSGLTLDDDEHEYRAEYGGPDTVIATIYDAVLIIGDSSMVSEGSDGESEPPPAPSGLMEGIVNEIKNFPVRYPYPSDGLQPDYWSEADANATLTEVDVAGEGITEKYARCLKLVVATAPSYFYQRYTYANEPRLKAGKTYSVAVDCWAVAGAEQRVRLQSSVGSLGVNSNDVAAWTRIEVEAVALDGTTLDLRLEGDVGTFYFEPLGLVEGIEAPTTQLQGRHEVFRAVVGSRTLLYNGDGATPFAITSLDISASVPPLTTRVQIKGWMLEPTAGEGYKYHTRAAGSVEAIGDNSVRLTTRGEENERSTVVWSEYIGPARALDHCLEQDGGSPTVSQLNVYLDGWYEWE